MSGGGPAADGAGNVYLLTANGAFETDAELQRLCRSTATTATAS